MYIELRNVFQPDTYYTHFPSRFSVSPPANGSEFDFVVVGSGSGGSTVAGRLAEAGLSVLLLEAGGPQHPLQAIPAFAPWFLQSPYDWGIKNVPGTRSYLGMKDKTFNLAMGKVLGGGSMLNFMMYTRGHSGDYDEWESLGNPGWGFRDVLPFFKKSEGFRPASEVPSEFHGTEGPLSVEKVGHTSPSGEMTIEAYRELGYEVGDINTQRLESRGFTDRSQVTNRDGFRPGTYKSYVEPLLGKADIEVLTHSLATKVIVEGGKAKGVVISRFGENLAYFARKEVILSSGAVGTPKLLMLSGIGPKEHLDEIGIPVVKDVPGVGNNLQGHAMVPASFHSGTPGWTTSPFATVNPINYLKLFGNGTGPLTNVGVDSTGLYANPSNGRNSRPTIQVTYYSYNTKVVEK